MCIYKYIFFYLKKIRHPRPPMSVHKKFQPYRSSCLAGYREHIYECLVLLYRYYLTWYLWSCITRLYWVNTTQQVHHLVIIFTKHLQVLRTTDRPGTLGYTRYTSNLYIFNKYISRSSEPLIDRVHWGTPDIRPNSTYYTNKSPGSQKHW